jgi:4-carboxymuconolactone decarboxylase
VPRIPYVDTDQLPESIKAALSRRPPLNLYRMLPNAGTPATEGFLALGSALLREGELDPQLRELAILRVGHLSRASYEVHQHERVADRVGLPQEKIEATSAGADAPVFDDRERTVLRYVDTLVHSVKASDEEFAAVRAQLGDRGICELTLTIGFYMLVSRFLENLEVEIEGEEAR